MGLGSQQDGGWGREYGQEQDRPIDPVDGFSRCRPCPNQIFISTAATRFFRLLLASVSPAYFRLW